ncbi:hypothetical protein WA577_007448, partial [Blastocystis sp. JDR]
MANPLVYLLVVVVVFCSTLPSQNDVRSESSCKIVDDKGVEYTSVSLVYRVETMRLKIKCDDFIKSASSSPRLPDNCRLSNDGSLSLELLNMQPMTSYNITIVGYKSNTTIPFS